MITLTADHWSLTGTLSEGHYGDGSLALQLFTDEGPETLTVNLIAYGLTAPPGHVFVPDYSEHAGLPAALAAAGVAVPVEAITFGPFDTAAVLMKVTHRR